MQTGNWGAFILSGQNKGLSTIRYREILYPARGVMTDYSQTKTDADSVRSYPVAVFRENDTHILVKNFYNYGADVVFHPQFRRLGECRPLPLGIRQKLVGFHAHIL